MSSTKQGFVSKIKITPRLLRWLMNCWPPFVGAGVKIMSISQDWRHTHVRLRMGLFNRNYVGTHFGGSLFAMTDPFYMIMVAQCLGKQYIVWDKAASIRFIAPGRSHVFTDITVTEEMLNDIRAKTANGEKYEPTYPIHVCDAAGKLIAHIDKTLYIRPLTNTAA